MSELERLIKRLQVQTDELYRDAEPHPRASLLLLPAGVPAPDALKRWAAFDRYYPWYLASRRSEQPIADVAGVVHAEPMLELLQQVVIEEIREEIDDEPETIAYLEELHRELSDEFPGVGIYLEPCEHPDRILWFGPDGPTVLWYENDAIDRQRPFVDWLCGLFE